MVAVILATTGQTAQGKSVTRITLPQHHLTLKQTIKWQKRIIRHDKWVIRTSKSHNLNIVKWHKAQLQWTTSELKQSLAKLRPQLDQNLVAAFTCIHKYEGSWNANTGNGYYGGLQMDLAFQTHYGYKYYVKWGSANNWPTWAQLQTAITAHNSGRGFYPWPNTARKCGLI